MSFVSSKIDFESLEEPRRFELRELIGEGTYGEVYAAIDLKTQEENPTGDCSVAIKILENLQENMEEAEEELIVLRDLSIHPNLPTFFGIYFKKTPRPEDSQLWFVMELCTGGSVTDLSQCLKKFEGRKLTEPQISYILKEVVDALCHLHMNKCMHRDVKGHNILLTADGRVKLIDFGVASHLSDTMARKNTSIGTPYWMAPEVIACERQLDAWYDVRCDVWSLGITAIELAEGEPPLVDLHPMRALFQIPRNPPPTLPKPEQWSREFNDFIAECLTKDFEQRPLMTELRQHPFLNQFDSMYEDSIKQQLAAEIELAKAHGNRLQREPEVTTKHGKLKTDRKSKLHTMFVDDLASLPTLDEETILGQLFHRFEQNIVYTYIGDILVAINPNQDIGIYTDFYQFKYRGASTADMAPHVFGMADQAYHAMLHQKRSQNVVISGESGAGKTETAKFLLQQFVYLGKAPNRNLEAKILHVNPIMEAFGNAETAMNENSSRFGKYLDVTFTRTGKVTGAKISVYLLEESRIDHQANGEQNFHIFYYLLDGLENTDLQKELKLDKKHYTYLQSAQTAGNSEANVEQFEAVKDGFYTLGFRVEEINSIYKVLAVILHLGEIRFDAGNEEEGCSVKNHDALDIVASLLGVSSGDLGLCLTTRSVVTCGETFMRRQSSMEARTTKDALARGLYNRLFRWIVNQINALLGISRLAYGDPLSIGILDIFGFEAFRTNSLEQLCINITNEQLQFYFNQHVFTWEQQEYMAEGIDIPVIHFACNRPILDLCLGKPLGVIALIDEESRFPRATEWTLLEKLNSNLGNNKFYQQSKSNVDCLFSVRHYAGRVQYNAKDFLKKNRNWHSPDLIQTLRNSEMEIVQALYRCQLTKTGHLHVSNRRESVYQLQKEGDLGLASQTRSQQTIATTFRHSLADLMSKLLAGDPHFIRCIKPNDFNEPEKFDLKKVVNQLRHSGVLETVKIRQLGYSHRFTFPEFLKRYCFLAFNFDERVVADKDSCRLLLLRLKMDGWALGKSKVFLRYYHVEYLAKLCEQQIRSIIFVQSCVRRWLAKIKLKKGMWEVAKTVVSAQKAAKVWMRRKRTADFEITPISGASSKKRGSYLRTKVMGGLEIINFDMDDDKTDEEKAAILIQSRFRGFMVRKKWGPVLEERIKQIVITHEKEEDAKKALEDEGLTEEDAAVVLQRFYRKWKVAKLEDDPPEEEKYKPREIQDTWDAPFKIIENHMRDLRAGITKREKVDMAAYRKEMIIAGLQTQDLQNLEREQIAKKKWNKVITSGDLVEVKEGRRMSKFGQEKLNKALEKKVLELRRPSKGDENKNKGALIKKVARLQVQPSSGSVDIPSPSEEDQGPIDFRKVLRKTNHSSTDSLRKIKTSQEE